MRNSRCGIIFPKETDVPDITGCLKLNGHTGPHMCIDDNGGIIEWQLDEKCLCDCWKDEDGSPCIIYNEIDKIHPDKPTHLHGLDRYCECEEPRPYSDSTHKILRCNRCRKVIRREDY